MFHKISFFGLLQSGALLSARIPFGFRVPIGSGLYL